ncbi:MAG TPA: SDR family NAD(P)-dependent oxidoreductase [Polyangia bacterium]|nr:SDR family NAD(P)-dependent oxidoreductase [Polyangia bacterium]
MAAASNLEGKQIVVTGGNGGLGPAVLRALVDAGATCHVPTRGDDAPAMERVRFVPGVDLASEEQVSRFYAGLPPLWASVHVAGGFAAAPIGDTSLEAFRRQLDVNLVTAFLCCREAVHRLRAAGAGGRIVNVGSRAAIERKGGTIAYSVAKAGVVALTECLADEVKEDDILVNVVLPSIIDTPTNRRAMPNAAADYVRWPKPPEIAAAIVWLCSPENKLVSGAALPVYGLA